MRRILHVLARDTKTGKEKIVEMKSAWTWMTRQCKDGRGSSNTRLTTSLRAAGIRGEAEGEMRR